MPEDSASQTRAKHGGYIKRQDFDEVLDELAQLLDSGSVDPKLAENARALIKRHPFKLFRCVIGGPLTLAAHEVPSSGPRTEPSDLILALIAALRANSWDAFAVIAHKFRS